MGDQQRTVISAAEALEKDADKGFACRVCGCRDMRVQRTDTGDDMRRRRRVCRNCGAVRVTTER